MGKIGILGGYSNEHVKGVRHVGDQIIRTLTADEVIKSDSGFFGTQNNQFPLSRITPLPI